MKYKLLKESFCFFQPVNKLLFGLLSNTFSLYVNLPNPSCGSLSLQGLINNKIKFEKKVFLNASGMSDYNYTSQLESLAASFIHDYYLILLKSKWVRPDRPFDFNFIYFNQGSCSCPVCKQHVSTIVAIIENKVKFELIYCGNTLQKFWLTISYKF